MNNDPELLKLCKAVYEATGWENGEWTNDSGDYVNPASELIREGIHFPLYDSDYLLEKLPKTLKRYGTFELVPTRANLMWSAGYWTHNRLDTFSVIGDTPLKALLNLTIRLSEEGLLK